MHAHLSDEALMLRYGSGDLIAFEELYRRHSRGLYCFIAWRSQRAEWVDEVMQESWASLHHARSRYEPLSSFRTYLYQIARNRLIDLTRQRPMLTASDLGHGPDGAAIFDHLADMAHQAVSPEAALDYKQQMAGLHAAILALPVEQKEALILQQFSGMSLEEIASLTAVSVETIKSRLRYAMRKLRSHFVGDLATEEEQA